jgi:cupin fold WbuC family metalloprotein
MKIYDKNNNLLAILIKANKIKTGRNFLTNNEEEMQVASFNFAEKTVIDNHIHLNQDRFIQTTPEILFVVSGKLKVFIFDEHKDFVNEYNLETGDTIALINGGHGLEVEKGTKLVEAKQGPYTEILDKKRF